VEALAHWLVDRQLSPWLDKWELRAGEPWLPALERAIGAASAMLVCVGRHGDGRVQLPEVQLALDRALAEPARQVIPVLLPGAPADASLKLQGFLKLRTWIDLRDSKPEAYDQLELALRGQAIGAPQRSQQGCPFRGLKPFDEEHARWFFGRNREIAECLQALRERRLLAVIGASGSGKSSLVRAGLIPAVRTGQLDGNYHWLPIVLRPAALPLRELALRLPHVLTRRAWTVDQLSEQFQSSSFLADELDAEAVAANRADRRFLLVIDQFEEVFSAGVDPKQRRLFLEAIIHAASVAGGRTSVVLTVRADFMSVALREEHLARQLNAAAYLLGPMGQAGLRDAIRHPARIAGVMLDEGLESLLLDSLLVEGTSTEAGDLPLLQFGLEELWLRREQSRLTVRAYNEMGGLKGALTRRADQVLAELRAHGLEDTARRLFGRLIQVGEGTPDTRRRLDTAELIARHREVERPLQSLIEARLLTAHENSVEIAHEALIREWPTLKSWIDDSRVALRIQGELTRAADSWHASRDAAELWRGLRLRRAAELAAEGTLLFSTREQAFLTESEAAAEHESRELEAQRQQELAAAQLLAEAQQRELTLKHRELRRARFFAGALLALVVVAAISAYLLNLSYNHTVTAEKRASSAELGRARLAAAASCGCALVSFLPPPGGRVLAIVPMSDSTASKATWSEAHPVPEKPVYSGPFDDMDWFGNEALLRTGTYLVRYSVRQSMHHYAVHSEGPGTERQVQLPEPHLEPGFRFIAGGDCSEEHGFVAPFLLSTADQAPLQWEDAMMKSFAALARLPTKVELSCAHILEREPASDDWRWVSSLQESDGIVVRRSENARLAAPQDAIASFRLARSTFGDHRKERVRFGKRTSRAASAIAQLWARDGSSIVLLGDGYCDPDGPRKSRLRTAEGKPHPDRTEEWNDFFEHLTHSGIPETSIYVLRGISDELSAAHFAPDGAISIAAFREEVPECEEIIEENEIIIFKQVSFKYQTDIPDVRSKAVLDAVAETLVGDPQITLVEIIGHAFDAAPAHRFELSERRAKRVRDAFVERGVAAARLTTKGVGYGGLWGCVPDLFAALRRKASIADLRRLAGWSPEAETRYLEGRLDECAKPDIYKMTITYHIIKTDAGPTGVSDIPPI
jgi:hypothetical protein